METFWEVVKDWTILLLKVYGCLLVIQLLLYMGDSNLNIPYVAPVFLFFKDVVSDIQYQLFGYR